MIFDEIKNMYKNKEIDIKEYRIRMFQKYEELLDYKALIKHSHISQITISDEAVIFTITNKDINGHQYDIQMVLYDNDAVAVPATMLSTEDGYEPEELQMVNLLCSYCRDDGIFIDAGANLGWYSLNICKQYPQMISYAFEPIPETYKKMKKNIELNHLSNCNSYNMGLSDENRTAAFFYDIAASGASSMVDLREMDTTVKVYSEIRRLDDVIGEENIEHIDFIKCDVEGAELFVLKGVLENIKKHKPIIFSEMLRKWSAKFNYHPNDIIHLLESVGYECYIIAPNNRLKKFGYVDDDTVETNYFFLHPEKHSSIISDLRITT